MNVIFEAQRVYDNSSERIDALKYLSFCYCSNSDDYARYL